MNLSIKLLALALIAACAHASLSLLGIRSGSLHSATPNSNTNYNHDSESSAGPTSFSVDTRDKDVTKLVGTALQFNVDSLQIATLDGLLKLSNAHAQFQKGNGVWKTIVEESTVRYLHNDRNVLVLDISSDDMKQAKFTFPGEAVFGDVSISGEIQHAIMTNLCRADRTLIPLPVDVVDPVANTAAVDRCSSDMADTHMSLSDIQDYTSKLLITAANQRNRDRDALHELQNVITNLSSATITGVDKEAPDEKERLHSVMSGFEAVVDALRLELTGKFKTLRSGFDTMQGEWATIDDRFSALDSNLSSRMISSMVPLYDTVQNQEALLLRNVTSLNASLHQLILNKQDAVTMQLEMVNNSLMTTNRELSVLNESTLHMGKYLNSTFQNLTLAMDFLDRSLTESLNNKTSTIETAMQNLYTSNNNQFQQLAANFSSKAELIDGLIADTFSQRNQSLAMMDSLSAHNITLVLLAENLTSLNVSATEYTNASIAALHNDVMSEFVHLRKESSSTLLKLNTSMLARAELIDTRIAAFEWEVVANISKALTVAADHTTASAQLLKEDLLKRTTEVAELQQFSLSNLQSDMQTMRLELENATISFYNSTTEAIAELITNTSNVLARSNSIFARAIGEVNSTMLLNSANLSGNIDSVRSELEEKMEITFAKLAQENNQTHAELTAASTQAFHRTEVLLNNTGATLESAIVQNISMINATVRDEIVRLNILREMDQRAAADTIEAIASLDSRSTVTFHELRSEIQRLNASTIVDLLALTNKLAEADKIHDSALQETSKSLIKDFEVKLLASEVDLEDKLQETALDLEDFIATRTKELTQSMVNLSSFFNSGRLNDAAKLDVRLNQTDLHIVEIKESLIAAENRLRLDLGALETHSSYSLGKMNSTLRDVILALDVREAAADAKQAEDLNRTTTMIFAAITDSEVKSNTSRGFIERQVHALNDSVVANLVDFREEVRVEMANNMQLSQAELEQESEKLSSAISNSIREVETATNSALNSAVDELRFTINQTTSALRTDSEIFNSRFSTLLSESTTKQASDKLQLDTALQSLSAVILANVTALHEADKALASAQEASFASLRSDLYGAYTEGSKRTDAVFHDIRTSILTLDASTMTALNTLRKKVDSTNESVNAVARDFGTQLIAAESYAHKQLNTVNESLHARLFLAVQEIQSVKEQTVLNATLLQAQLADALNDVSTHASAGLNKMNSSMMAQVEKIGTEFREGLVGARKDFAEAIELVNRNAQSEAKARTEAESILKAEIVDISTKLLNENAEVARLLSNHSAAISANEDAVFQQKAFLMNTLSNFTSDQSALISETLRKVDVRVQEAQFEVRLNNVALDAVRNETSHLADIVLGVTEKMGGLEVRVATVQTDVSHIQLHQQQLARLHENMTVLTLPGIFSKLGALQFGMEEQSASSLRFEMENRENWMKFEAEAVRAQSSLSAVKKSVESVGSELNEAKISVSGAVHQLQQQYISVAIQSNTSAAQVSALSTAVEKINSNISHIPQLQLQSTHTQQRLSAVEQQLNVVDSSVKLLQSSSQESTADLRELLHAQAAQIRELEASFKRQQSEIVGLQEENRRLVRESATVQSTDDLRRILFDLQGQMLTHSSKVLDLLLQPRSAVLINPPVPAQTSTPAPVPAAPTSNSDSM